MKTVFTDASTIAHLWANQTTYKDVFQLAQDKGYQIYFDWKDALESNPDHDEVYELNLQLTIAELTLIQKWLREKYEMYVCPTPNNSCSIYWRNSDTEIKWFPVLHGENEGEKESKFDTYEQALLEGCKAALRLL